jgi:hypothetical protein
MRRSIDGMMIYSLKATRALSGNGLGNIPAQHLLSQADMRHATPCDSVARFARGVPSYCAASFPSSK